MNAGHFKTGDVVVRSAHPGSVPEGTKGVVVYANKDTDIVRVNWGEGIFPPEQTYRGHVVGKVLVRRGRGEEIKQAPAKESQPDASDRHERLQLAKQIYAAAVSSSCFTDMEFIAAQSLQAADVFLSVAAKETQS